MTKNNGQGRDKWSRRHVLTTLGLTGLAMAPGMPKAIEKSDNATVITCATLGELANLELKRGMVVQTLGYFQAGDGGAAWYRIEAQEGKGEMQAGIVPLTNGLIALLLHNQAVNYKMFGAVGDGVHDDGLEIKRTHEYANKHNIPVINLRGEYWIKETNGIAIRTNVTWGHTIFHIDEQFNVKGIGKFVVQSTKKKQEISFNNEQKEKFLEALKPGVRLLPQLAPYSNALVNIRDNNDRIGFRAGAKFKGQSWAREELFYVEEHGCVVGDIAWEFKDFTSLTVYPCDDNYLVIDGGTFYLSGDSPGTVYNGYKSNGIVVNRSRTIIRNQWVGLEEGRHDVAITPRTGFYTFSMVYDVTLENVRLIPWEQNREGTDRDVPAGTYGISAGRMLNGTFRNVTAEGGPVHWGVFGTNLNKNFRIERCKLNRVDVHFHCWNLCITDSNIGYRGISVTGGGELLIKHTVCHNQSFVNFRRDFGSKWDGCIRISNCRFVPPPLVSSTVLNFHPLDAEYRYPISLGRSIRVEDLVIDLGPDSSSQRPCWLVNTPEMSRMSNGDHLIFPRELVFRNVSVVGSKHGVRLMKLYKPQHYRVDLPGGYNEVQLHTNAQIRFENIQLEILKGTACNTDAHLTVVPDYEQPYVHEYALYPSIHIVDCKGFLGVLKGSVAEILFSRSSIISLECGDTEAMQGSLFFQNCVFQPVADTDTAKFYTLEASLGTSFTNCVVHAPVISGRRRYDLSDCYGFLAINDYVLYNHVNTRLGRDIVNHLFATGGTVHPDFVAKLKSHHELEPFGAKK
ncbi:hypothetical protein SAMN05421747_101328 [Parapedobacter composti]|uniref:Uncharacterized protein n=1 Tax=Parapedobacter composti TaxID=623281 RepID=A0A1I1E4M3_9SPHI|nr:hypothetical protein [Parapedobacter composti]SFB82189.1 hypothetical protein SAMN05421747_101328 [Parapedobacter composti]